MLFKISFEKHKVYLFMASLSLVITAHGSSLQDRATLLGDPGGYRSQLQEQGIGVEMVYFSTFMGTVTGGMDRGSAYKGNFKLGVDADLEQLFGLPGGRFFVSGFNHHGDSLSRRDIGDSLGNRKDDVEDSTQLFEFGYEQHLFDDRLSLKLGQLAVTSDFFGSKSGFFLHDSFNWQPNGQSGAPSGPDSSIGMRVKFQVTEDVYVQAGVYDNGTSGNFGDDDNDKHGVKWSVPHGNRAVWFFESGFVPQTEEFAHWPLLKVGGWVNDGDTQDLLTGNPEGSNWGLYVIGEHTLWTEDGDEGQGVDGFARFNWTTPDRNQIECEFNLGVLYTGIIPQRDHDVLGLGFTHAEVSDDWQTANTTGASEEAFELKYQAQVTPWLNVEPFAQYIINPGRPSGRDLNDALVLGMISTVVF